MPRQAAFVLCALLVGSARSDDATTKKRKKRASKDWSKVDLDAVGREWESGDEADELLRGGLRQRLLVIAAAHRGCKTSRGSDGPLSNEVELRRAARQRSGPAAAAGRL